MNILEDATYSVKMQIITRLSQIKIMREREREREERPLIPLKTNYE